MIQKTSAPGSAEPQLRKDCLSFWSVKAELGLRGPGGRRTSFFQDLVFHENGIQPNPSVKRFRPTPKAQKPQSRSSVEV